MSALKPRVFRTQIVILVVLALGIGAAAFVSAAAEESEWLTIDADKHLDSNVSVDEGRGIFVVRDAGRVLALSMYGPWLNELVEYCPSSQMFETRRSGSKFDLHGLYVAGPAPQGMSRYSVRLIDGDVQIRPDELVPGPSRVASRGHIRQPAGRFCVPV